MKRKARLLVRRAAWLIATGLVVVLTTLAYPHSGGLDRYGCHTNRETGEYHCHRAVGLPVAPKQTLTLSDSNPLPLVVKKSRSGICHTPDSPYYGRTLYFTSHPSLEACLASGGRLPR
jgi:hypothetical protein